MRLVVSLVLGMFFCFNLYAQTESRSIWIPIQEKPSLRSRMLTGLLGMTSVKKKQKQLCELDSTNLLRRLEKKSRAFEQKNRKNSALSAELTTFQGRKLVLLSHKKKVNKQKLLIYFHGGGYMFGITKFHWKFCRFLAKHSDYQVLVVDYPLTPRYEARYTMAFALDLYKKYAQKENITSIVLAGDSAGGGLALALGVQVTNQELPKLRQLLLLSPWVNLSTELTYLEEYAQSDKMLNREAIQCLAAYYTTKVDREGIVASPLFADFKGLPSIQLYVGDEELLYPQQCTLAKKLSTYTMEKYFFSAIKGQHVFVLWPIREAKKAHKKIITFLP